MRRDIAARTLKVIAAIQIAGGAVGAVLAIVILPQLAAQAGVPPWKLLPWLVPPFALSLVAGTLLWRGRGVGEILSLTNLVLQIPVISTPLLSYFFNAGLAIRIWLGPDGPGSFVFLGSQFHLNIAPQTSDTLLGVNVVALALLILLIRAMPGEGVPVPEVGAAQSA